MKILIQIALVLFFGGFQIEAGLKPVAKHVPNYKYELSVVAIFRDEARFLKEWIEFHKLVGVEHFWLYNNCSKDNFQEVLAPYIAKGEVELIDWSRESLNVEQWNKIQNSAYKDGIGRSLGLSSWVAVLDTDEFLFPVQCDNLAEFLRGFKGVGAVTANWQMYGTSGIERIPEGYLMIDLLQWKLPTEENENIHIKSIVRPIAVQDCVNPHYFELRAGYAQVDSENRTFTGPFSPSVNVSKIRINHYWARDIAFMNEVKVARRVLWGMPVDSIFTHEKRMNAIQDDSIQRFSERLKAQMGL